MTGNQPLYGASLRGEQGGEQTQAQILPRCFGLISALMDFGFEEFWIFPIEAGNLKKYTPRLLFIYLLLAVHPKLSIKIINQIINQ